MPSYWMLVTTKDNYNITREMGFKVQGVKSKHRKRAQRMLPGDRVLYFIQSSKCFPGTATSDSGAREEHDEIWVSHNGKEDFPYRVDIHPNLVLEDREHLDGYQLGPGLHYVKRWAPEDWDLAFQDHLHLLSQRDFGLIEDEMRRVMRNR